MKNHETALLEPWLESAEAMSRKRVWVALSEFWLDTELDVEDIERIARTLAESPFSIAELEDIYVKEVAPVVYLNTYVVAGEWAGFDEPLLALNVRRQMLHCGFMLRTFMWLGLARRVMCYATERHWSVMAKRVPELRALALSADIKE